MSHFYSHKKMTKQLEYLQSIGLKYIAKGVSAPLCKGSATPRRGTASPLKTSTGISSLEQIRAEIGDCKRCRLCKGKKNIVFGVGNPKAKLMFVGEGPGRDEDAKGEPFVGRAGQLLDKIIIAMGYKRSDVYIGNIVKCRPPENRQPLPDEMGTCLPFLLKQIEAIQPKIIVCLGATALKGLLQTEAKISQVRGQFQEWNGISVMPTYHPAFLLRNPDAKRFVWDDMKKV